MINKISIEDILISVVIGTWFTTYKILENLPLANIFFLLLFIGGWFVFYQYQIELLKLKEFSLFAFTIASSIIIILVINGIIFISGVNVLKVGSPLIIFLIFPPFLKFIYVIIEILPKKTSKKISSQSKKNKKEVR